jgi:hypothetical protein
MAKLARERTSIVADLGRVEKQLAGGSIFESYPGLSADDQLMLEATQDPAKLLARKADLEQRLMEISREMHTMRQGGAAFKPKFPSALPLPAAGAKGGGGDISDEAKSWAAGDLEMFQAQEDLYGRILLERFEKQEDARQQALKKLRDWGEENKKVAEDTASGMSFHFENIFI